MDLSFLLNGKLSDILLHPEFTSNMLRLYQGDKNTGSYITINGKQEFVANANATLRKDEWIELDRVVVKAAKERLNLVGDLRRAGLSMTIAGGMGKTILQTQNQSDINAASISMNGNDDNQNDRPLYDLTNLPLPIIHKDFTIDARQLAASRQGGSPLDTSMAALASRQVADTAEQLATGVLTTYSYGGGTVYGLVNFPDRLTKSMTLPTATGWTGKTFIDEILDMRQQSVDAKHYGPFKLYVSPNWDRFLDADYADAKGDNTLRMRTEAINTITGVTTLDFLTGFQVVLVQQTEDVIRMINGMDPTTLQWETNGGLQINFKVMTIMVPQLRADFNGNTGIVHGTAS